MRKSDIKVLIVEDDESLGPALAETMKRSGFQAVVVTNPDEALIQARSGEYSMAVIDCLLPRGNGVELAERMRQAVGDDFRIIMTSGIYKDKVFIRDAQHRAQASGFLLKPFEASQLVETAIAALGEELDADLPPLLETITTFDIPAALRQKALERSEGLHGFDLPQIYSLILNSNLTGTLNIVSGDGDVSALSFREGQLTNVNLNDKTSYFGVLLVEMGYTSAEEVEEGLANPGKAPLGERLVESLSLSPHAIRVVRVEQMLIRLSKSVSDNFVDITFMQSEVAPSEVAIGKEQYSQILWDLICSKIPVDWFKNYYDRWLEHPLALRDEHTVHRRMTAIAGLHQQASTVFKKFNGQLLSEIIEGNEAELLPIIHFLIIEKLARFGPKKATARDNTRILKRLKTVYAEMQNKNHFGILGLTQKAQDKEINRSYTELAKVYHPDKLPPSAPQEVRDLNNKIFARITNSHDFLRDPNNRANYVRELEQGKAEKALHIESQVERSLGLLRKGKYKEALQLFAELAKTAQHRGDLNIYLAWAKLKHYSGRLDNPESINKLMDMLNRVPPEDRHSSHYFYAKALMYREIGDFEKAKTNLKHALVLEPGFMEARRDLAIVREQIQKQQGRLQGDFSTVVNMFLGRKRR